MFTNEELQDLKEIALFLSDSTTYAFGLKMLTYKFDLEVIQDDEEDTFLKSQKIFDPEKIKRIVRQIQEHRLKPRTFQIFFLGFSFR